MKQSVSSRDNVHERSETRNLNDNAVIGFTERRHVRICNLINHLRGLFCRIAACRSYVHGTVILNCNFGSGIFLNLVDNLALRPDYFANLVNRNGHRHNARSIRTHFCWLVNAFFNNFKNCRTSLTSLLQSTGENVCRNAVKLRIKLQGSNKFRSSRHFEIHVAESVFRAENIGKRFVSRHTVNIACNKSHCNSRNRRLNRNAGCKQRQSRSAYGTHGSRTV